MTVRTVAELDREIAKLQQYREEAIKREAALNKLPLEQRVAIVMHDHMCISDHTEHCGWFYEIICGDHNFLSPAHDRWLKRARATVDRLRNIKALSNNDILAVVEAVTF